MKKNKMMRIASILMVATLITTCAISGTFAKYVTKVEGSDSARVAKWGIVLGLEAGDIFAAKYQTHDKDAKQAGLEYSVEAANGKDKLVAPGTSSEDTDGKIVGTVKGTPEVATRYTLTVKEFTDVVLPKGNGYVDYTELKKDETTGKYDYTGKFDLAKDYAPVKWDLLINGKSLAQYIMGVVNEEQANALGRYGLTAKGVSFTDAKAIAEKVAELEVEDVVAELIAEKLPGAVNFAIDLETLSISIDVPANTAMDYTFELVWSWDFDDNGKGTNDKADTYLGNVAAGVVTDQNANTTISATLVATATQID